MANKTFCELCGVQGHKTDRHVISKHTMPCNTCLKEIPLNLMRSDLGRRKSDGSVVTHYRRVCRSCKEYKKSKYRSSSWSARFDTLILSIKSRNHKWGLKDYCVSKDYLFRLLDKQHGKCYLSGRKMSIDYGDHSVSVDRIDSSKGYTEDNIALTCWSANRMKSTMSVDELLDWCQDIIDNKRTCSLDITGPLGC